MAVIVVGCGRSGTNLTLEILRASNYFNAFKGIEDKNVFFECKALDKDYLSKCDTCYIPSFEHIDRLIENNPHLKFVFTLRDPKSMSLSKIYRGRCGRDGNFKVADDATVEGCISDISHAYKIFKYMSENYPDIIFAIKMEDIISDFENTVTDLIEFLGFKYKPEMKDFSFRNPYKKDRYGNKLHSSQVDLWSQRDSIYGRFFKDNQDIIEIFNSPEIQAVIKGWSY